MKRVHFATMSTNVEGKIVLTLDTPDYNDKAAAKKGARDHSPDSYYLITFDSPDPVVVEPPPAAVRNVAKFGKPFVERAKKAAKAATTGKGKK